MAKQAFETQFVKIENGEIFKTQYKKQKYEHSKLKESE